MLLLLALSASPPAASAGDKDCADFPNQKKAQKFFKKHDPKRDPHYLDADNDGIACEDNPCPCKFKPAFSHPHTDDSPRDRAFRTGNPNS